MAHILLTWSAIPPATFSHSYMVPGDGKISSAHASRLTKTKLHVLLSAMVAFTRFLLLNLHLLSYVYANEESRAKP